MSREGGSPRKAFIYFPVQCTDNTCLNTAEWLWTLSRTCSEDFPWWLTQVSWVKENGRGWRGSENYQKLKNNPERKQKPSSPPRSGKSRGGEFDTVSGSWVGGGGGGDFFRYFFDFIYFLQFRPFLKLIFLEISILRWGWIVLPLAPLYTLQPPLRTMAMPLHLLKLPSLGFLLSDSEPPWRSAKKHICAKNLKVSKDCSTAHLHRKPKNPI